jgi:hypothetical protein
MMVIAARLQVIVVACGLPSRQTANRILVPEAISGFSIFIDNSQDQKYEHDEEELCALGVITIPVIVGRRIYSCRK